MSSRNDVVDSKLPKLNPIVIPNKSEHPPLLKKSCTISAAAAAATDPPHFPGPLFTAVRRLSTSPSSSSWSTRSFDSDSSFFPSTPLPLPVSNPHHPSTVVIIPPIHAFVPQSSLSLLLLHILLSQISNFSNPTL